MKANSVSIFVCSAISFFFGCIVSTAVNFDGWSLNREVDLLRILSIVTPLIMFITVSVSFDRNKEQTKLKKDIMVKKIDGLLKLLDNISHTTLSSKVGCDDVAYSFKSIFKEYDSLYKFVSCCSFECINFKEEFLAKYKVAKKLATDTPRKDNPSKEIQVSGSDLLYTSTRLGMIRGGLCDLSDILLKEQVRLIDRW